MVGQLKAKIKEQENSISELSSAVECFLKIQPIVKKLQVNISKISNHVVPNVPQDKFKVTVPKIGDPEIVKPFTPSLENAEVMTTHQEPMENSELSQYMKHLEFQLELQTRPGGLHPGDPMYDNFCKMYWKSYQKEIDQLKCRQANNVKSVTSDEKSQCQDTSADTTKHPITSEKKSCKRLQFMATPKKQSRVTSINSDSGSPTESSSDDVVVIK